MCCFLSAPPPLPLSSRPSHNYLITPLTPHPRFHHLPQKDPLHHYRDLIAASTVHTLNAALCDYHMTTCPPSDQLTQVGCG
jgi:hypothetical protein